MQHITELKNQALKTYMMTTHYRTKESGYLYQVGDVASPSPIERMG